MYTVTEVAKIFSVSRQTVLKWINNGKIKAVKVVKVYRIPKREERSRLCSQTFPGFAKAMAAQWG